MQVACVGGMLVTPGAVRVVVPDTAAVPKQPLT
jgi:hypothetical protein